MTDQGADNTSPAARTLMGSIRVYQKVLSPFMGGRCRFHPSCSHYGHEAIQVHGAAKGSWMAVKRIGRCQPFHDGGLDPVPPRSDELPGNAA